MKDYKKLLTDFYTKHNPEKILEVSDLLDKYKGQEEELLTKLHEKYKVKNYTKLLTDFYLKHNPEKILEVPGLLSKYEGQEEELLLNLYRKYKINQEVVAENKPIITQPINPKNEKVNTEKTVTTKNNKKLFVIVGTIILLVIAGSIVGVKYLNVKSNEVVVDSVKVEDGGQSKITDQQVQTAVNTEDAQVSQKEQEEEPLLPNSNSPENKAYNEALESGEQAIKDGRLNVAIMHFKVAESLKPEEKLPPERIKEIEAMDSSTPSFIVTAKKHIFIMNLIVQLRERRI